MHDPEVSPSLGPDSAATTGSPLSRLARAFYEPGAVFTEIARQPSFIWALVVLVVMALATQLVIGPRVDYDETFRRGLAESPRGAQMTDEQADQAVAAMEKFAKVQVVIAPAIAAVVMLLLGGLYFLGLKAVGSDAEFKPVLAAVLHAHLPPGLVNAALLMVVAAQRTSFAAQELETMVRSNLAAWLDPETPKALLALARTIDVFNVWTWVLLAIGLSIVGRVSRGKAIAVVAVLWGGWAVAKAALAAAF